MKLFLNILTSLLFVLPIQASNNVIDIAKDLAKEYCQTPTLKKTGVKPSSQLRSASSEDPSYYIFADDENGKFCIISANGESVLGYGDNYSDELPPQLQSVLDMYATSDQHPSELRSAKIREDIPAFMNVKYSTRSPYNKYIPLREGSGPPVGCVPVALAQICKYYEHPAKLMNDIPGYAHISATNPDTIYQIEGQKAEGRTYNWDLILNHYKKDTTEELNNEIAKLMWDCARSVETMFAQSGSSALSEMFYYSLIHYYGYNSDSLRKISRNGYYREEWLDIIHEELSKKRPIYMSGTSYKNGGHAFICDGYVDGFLHINWGWNGSGNGYFDTDILDYNHNKDNEQSSPDNGYSFFEQVIIGIEPGVGKTEYERPQSSTSIVQSTQDGVSFNARYRATENGFKMYTSFDAYSSTIDSKRFFAIGYVNKNNKLVFMGNGKSAHFSSNSLKLKAEKEFDSSYLGKNMKLYILETESERIETLVQDSIYTWWHPSNLFDSITISIPDTINENKQIIVPNSVGIIGEYADSTIVLNVSLETERPEGCMKYLALALVSDGDTLMSEISTNYTEKDNEEIPIKRSLKNPDFDKEMTLLVLQSDNISKGGILNPKEWSICQNFDPISFKLSDCTIYSKEFVIDTIVHSTKGTLQRFEITISNPTPFEFYNDVYFLVDNEPSGAMISIPAGETKTTIIERETPEVTRYINGLFAIYNYFDVATEIVYTKDTFSHVFYGFKGGNESTIALQILNGTKKNYNNTFILRSDSDTIASQSVNMESLTVAQLNYSLPPIVSDTTFLRIGCTLYSVYDKDENLLGEVIPLNYYGLLNQSLDKKDKIISVYLWPVIDTVMPPLNIGITSSLEDLDHYERLKYVPDSGAKAISIDFKLKDYCSLKEPKYIGLCKEDGSFYAYLELVWSASNSSANIPSCDFSIIVVDGGVWICSDVEIPSLPIYNIEGKLVKTVGVNPASTIFVPLTKGTYIVGGKKFIIRNS